MEVCKKKKESGEKSPFNVYAEKICNVYEK